MHIFSDADKKRVRKVHWFTEEISALERNFGPELATGKPPRIGAIKKRMTNVDDLKNRTVVMNKSAIVNRYKALAKRMVEHNDSS